MFSSEAGSVLYFRLGDYLALRLEEYLAMSDSGGVFGSEAGRFFLLLGSEESFAERMEVEECCYFRLGDYFELRLEEYLLSEVGGEFGSEAGRVFGSEVGGVFTSEVGGVFNFEAGSALIF